MRGEKHNQAIRALGRDLLHLIHWKNLTGKTNLPNETYKLIEKAVIAEAIRHNAQIEYCFLSTDLESAMRSEGIALITSELILQPDKIQNLKQVLDEGANLYREQTKIRSPELLEEFKKQYTTITDRQLETLVDQHLLCKNMTSHDLTKNGQQKVLSAMIAY